MLAIERETGRFPSRSLNEGSKYVAVVSGVNDYGSSVSENRGAVFNILTSTFTFLETPLIAPTTLNL